ncbi:MULTISPECIES: helix-turn-helix domain-containing protein [unclassified Streptomyces]|uniref:helix-turn-helix domain-containing protein n=1 Tax=unclassified Streptomyces TaxID=2593676 RepID=UPI0033B5E9EF
MSTRTLQRRPDDHGTTWTEGVDSVRRAAVTRLPHDTDLGVAAVAARSGYADARAVHRWYGTTPAALRRAGPGSPTG